MTPVRGAKWKNNFKQKLFASLMLKTEIQIVEKIKKNLKTSKVNQNLN